ncbi:MAG TPA: hypothetical protein VFE05_21845 [Longimicrobiaceae bacterium]|nr:hypothetical protein [Longimicrobiaceae bacterium]
MRKLKLDLGTLEVDSFDTSWLNIGTGTVFGEDASAGPATQCGGVQTCGGGCQVTAGGATQCGGVQTCGEGCQVSAGGATQCGGVQTCGQGCNK